MVGLEKNHPVTTTPMILQISISSQHILVLLLCIKIEGNALILLHKVYIYLYNKHIHTDFKFYVYTCTGSSPSSGPSARRADHSLPQPLHLKAVFTDHKEWKASIRFKFVNSNITV